jgi:signal peptidase I
MSKRRSSSKRPRRTGRSGGGGPDSGNLQGPKGAGQPQAAQRHVPSAAAVRETIESVVVAFVLAFLFRTFEAEAFVIPTGSMAPTLMGRHKDLTCPICGYPFRVSASDEVDSNTNALLGPDHQIVGCTCPMCRYPVDLRSAVAAELGDELTEEIERVLTEELDLAPEVAAELAGKIKRKPAPEIEDQLARELNLPYGRAADVAEKLAEEIERIVANGLKKKYPSFKGDRILVGKFCYQFTEPERWDVAVFKYPGGAKTNFIKRLVGLPGETVRIYHGDIFLKQDDHDFTIARKQRPGKLLAMLQPVYDNDYVLPKIIKLGWPARWAPLASRQHRDAPPGKMPVPPPSLKADATPAHRAVGDRESPSDGSGSSQGTWTTSKDCRSFRTDGRAVGETWLRYQHIVPSPYQWQYLKEGRLPPDAPPRRQLISDFCAYNTCRAARDSAPDADSGGLHWVGDLAVRCTLEVLSDCGEAVFELVEGGWRMQCRIDVATGKAALAIDHEAPYDRIARTIDGEDYRPIAQTAVRGPGKYKIIFSNCDDQLRLWVDGKAVQFDTTTCYAPLLNWRPHDSSFASDFSPVGVGSQGAALRISHLKVLRDIYYIAVDSGGSSASGALTDFQQLDHLVLSDPSRWDAFDTMHMVDFPLEEDQFLALGDNSPKSKDSRLWQREGFEYYVGRELLIGKALFVYWPHSWNKLPGTNIPFPLFPNFSRMGFVR